MSVLAFRMLLSSYLVQLLKHFDFQLRMGLALLLLSIKMAYEMFLYSSLPLQI